MFRHSKITSVYWGSFEGPAVIFQLLASVTQLSGLCGAAKTPHDSGNYKAVSLHSLPLSVFHMAAALTLSPFLLASAFRSYIFHTKQG